MCPGCDIAVAMHETRSAQPPLLELVKDAASAASGRSATSGPGVPEPDEEGPLYVARRKI